jgi:hypothetical protein
LLNPAQLICSASYACEQSGTESRLWACHHSIGGDVNSGLSSSALRPFFLTTPVLITHKRRSGGILMEPGSFRNRLGRSLAPIRNFLTKLFAVPVRPPQGYGTQRVCPFCGRITPRSQRLCLECGKSLRGIQMPPKDARQG